MPVPVVVHTPARPVTTTPTVTAQLSDSLKGKDKDEVIRILLEKVQTLEVNHDLFIKLQDELKQKEKQYEILRGKQKLDQEGKKIAEERLEVAKGELKKKEEEMSAKDKHIRQLTKKLKQARKEWINDINPNTPNTSSSNPVFISTSPGSANNSYSNLSAVTSNIPVSKSWTVSPELDLKNREINQLKEAIWAHQSQNAALQAEVSIT